MSTLTIMLLLLSFQDPNGLVDNIQIPLENNQANQMFEKQNYEEALKSYLDLYGRDPGNAAVAYNLANTYAALGDMEKAKEFYNKARAGEHPEARDRAGYNLGTMELAEQKPKEAINKFVDYLREHPDDADAKRNLELSLKLLEQQQQQQQQQDNQDQENQEDQQDNQQQQQQSQQQDQQDQQDQQQQDQQQQDQQQQDQQQDQQDQQDQQQDQQDQQDQQQDQQDQQDQQQDQQDQQDQQQSAAEEDESDEEQQPRPQSGEQQEIDEAMKDQILDALKEQEEKQQKAYQERKIGRPKKRAKDW